MERFKVISKTKIDQLPKTTGVYIFFTKNSKSEIRNSKLSCIYIGKAINIQSRVKNHFHFARRSLGGGGTTFKDNILFKKTTHIGYLETNSSEIEALILEANLIKKYQPKFNVIWKDDKNYFYVAIAKNSHKVPYVFTTHYKLPTQYIGPFVEGTALKKTLRFLRRAFPYYTLAKHSKNKCTYCHLDLCPGPRLFEARLASPKGEAANLIAEYKKNIKKLILVLKGKRNAVLHSLKKEMKAESKKQNFEKAGKARDKIYVLQQIMAHTRVINGSKPGLDPNAGYDTKKTLQELLGAKKDIRRIECYDISNIQGKQATGSMVVFVDGAPAKSQYKKFKIKMKSEPNDIAMLKETIYRRLNHAEWDYPDLMLIDGGKAQLNIAISTIKQFNALTIPVISLAKKNNKLYIEGKNTPVLLKTLPREIFNLILQLRDEAHRFAITYHKKLREKNLLQN